MTPGSFLARARLASVIDADPVAAALIDLDVHNRVNLPERLARLPQLLWMLLIEEQPAANAHMRAFEFAERIEPAWTHVQDTRGNLNHDRLRSGVGSIHRQPDVIVAVRGGMTVR